MHVPEIRKEEEDDGEDKSCRGKVVPSVLRWLQHQLCVPCQDPGDEDLLFSLMEYALGKVSDLGLKMNIVLF